MERYLALVLRECCSRASGAAMNYLSEAKAGFGCARTARRAAVVSCAMIAAAISLGARGDVSIIQPAMRDWVKAAKTSRADIWFVGDSIAGVFDSGFSDAISKHFGLAGTGVGNDFGGGNNSFTTTPPYPLGSNGWTAGTSAVRADRQDYVLSYGEPITAGASTAQYYTTFINPGGYLNPQAAYDWHLWTASPDGGGSMQARRYIAGAAVSVPQLNAPITTGMPAS